MTTTTPLCLLAQKYGSDKCPQLKNHYTPYYYELFAPRQNQVKKLLEIGIGDPQKMTHVQNYQPGASLFMWRDFFPLARIYGLDFAPNTLVTADRIQSFLGDQTDKETLIHLLDNIGHDIDIVIDDGSHSPPDQITTCLTLMPLLPADVDYIIEDVWKPLALFNALSDRYDVFSPYIDGSVYRRNRLIIVKHKFLTPPRKRL